MNRDKVLVVEDYEPTRKLTALILRLADFEVYEAEDGFDCLGKALNLKPDIILLDVMMPIISGWEVCEKVRATPEIKTLPIIMFTIRNSIEDVALAHKYGVSAYILKPFTPENLVAKVKDVLAAVRAVRVAKKDFNDELLVWQLLEAEIIKEDKNHPEYVYFDSNIKDKSELIGRLEKIGLIIEEELIVPLWQRIVSLEIGSEQKTT